MKKILAALLVLLPVFLTAATTQNKVSMVTFFPVPYVAYSNISVAKQMDIGLTNQTCSLSLGSTNATTNPLDVQNTNVTNGTLFLSGDGAISTTGNVGLGSASSPFDGQVSMDFARNLRVNAVTDASSLNTPELHVSSLQLFGRTFPACNVNGNHQIAWAELALGPNKNKKEMYLVCGPIPQDCPASTRPSETCACSAPHATGSRTVSCNASSGEWQTSACTCACDNLDKPTTCSCSGGGQGTPTNFSCNSNTGYWNYSCTNCQCKKSDGTFGTTETEDCSLGSGWYASTYNDAPLTACNGSRTRTCNSNTGSWNSWGSCSNSSCCNISNWSGANCYACSMYENYQQHDFNPDLGNDGLGQNPNGYQYSFYYAAYGGGPGACQIATPANRPSASSFDTSTATCKGVASAGPAAKCYAGQWHSSSNCSVFYPPSNGTAYTTTVHC